MGIRERISIQIPDYQALSKFTCVDMHVHSNHSHDSFTKVDTLIARAKELGITFALTDHDEISGCVEIANRFPDFFFIPGIEVRCDRGWHTLIYFYSLSDLQEFYVKYVEPYRKKHNYPSAVQQIAWAKEYGAVCSAAHPFAPGMTAIMCDRHSHVVNKKILSAYDCYEVIQGENIPARNFPAIDLAVEMQKGITCGSDAHIVQLLGRAVTVVKKKDCTVKEFLNAIKKNKNECIGHAKLGWKTLKSNALKIKGPISQPSYAYTLVKKKVSKILS